jgi:hypothetical protein
MGPEKSGSEKGPQMAGSWYEGAWNVGSWYNRVLNGQVLVWGVLKGSVLVWWGLKWLVPGMKGLKCVSLGKKGPEVAGSRYEWACTSSMMPLIKDVEGWFFLQKQNNCNLIVPTQTQLNSLSDPGQLLMPTTPCSTMRETYLLLGASSLNIRNARTMRKHTEYL